jgi:hypothetical protein
MLCYFSLDSTREHMIFIYPIADDMHFDHLIKVVPSRCLYCEVTAHCNEYVFCGRLPWDYVNIVVIKFSIYSFIDTSIYLYRNGLIVSCIT